MARFYYPEGISFGWQDALVLVGYFALVIGVGVWSVRRKNKNDSVRGYFLAGRDMNWILVGTGLFGADVSSTKFIGLCGSAATTGIAVGGFELNAMFILLVLGWIFVPVYLASGVYTLPEFLLLRFGSLRIQTYLSALSLLLSLLIKISAELYAGAIFIEQTLHWNLYYSSLVLLAIAGIYTLVGGLEAVMWTDFLQTVFIVCGAAAISILSFRAVGGYEELIRQFPLVNDSNSSLGVHNSTCGKVPDDYMHLLRRADDDDYPWTGMIFGLTISSIWYWCSDQVIAQRCLSAKGLSHAKGGCILAGYLKALPIFLFVFPGMAARVLFPEDIACSSPEACQNACGSSYNCGDISYPLLVLRLMPIGARGFMMSVILASIMGSLTAIFNSCATLFTVDIWPRFRKKPSEVELLIVGRVFIIILAGLSVVWVPVIKATQGSQLFDYTQSITSYLGPPVCAVYLLAVFIPRINEKGAFWGLILGLAVGLCRFILDTVYAPSPCGSSQVKIVPNIVADIHYLHFGCILFALVSVVTLIISYCSTPIEEKHLHRLTFWTRHSYEERVDLNAPPPESPSPYTSEDTFPPMNFDQDLTDLASPGIHGRKTGNFSPAQTMSIETQEQPRSYNSILAKLCCMGNKGQSGPEHVPSSCQVVLEVQDRLREDLKWKWFVNVNALIMLLVAVSFWVVYK